MNIDVPNIPSIEDKSIQIAELLGPWMMILMSIIVVMMFKDFATTISKGIAFKLKNDFKEGDLVYIDGEKAIITKIGITTTVFDIVKSHEIENVREVWRYVPNERIPYLKIEKIIKE